MGTKTETNEPVRARRSNEEAGTVADERDQPPDTALDTVKVEDDEAIEEERDRGQCRTQGMRSCLETPVRSW